MTSRERILTAMKCGTPDRVPVSPWGYGHLDPDSAVARRLVEKTDFLDSVGISPSSPFLGGAVDSSTEERGSDTITTLKTPKGEFTQVRRRTETTQALVRFYCKDGSDVERFLSLPFEPVHPRLETFFSRKESIGEEGLVIAGLGDAICFPASILSPEDMCLLWMDDRDLMLELVTIAAERIKAFVMEACEKGVDAFRIVGGEYATQQIGSLGFNTLVKPFDTELCEIIHANGGIVHYHNHGHVDKFLEDFIDLGIDSLDPLEIPPYGNVDLAGAKERLSGEVCIVGPNDDMEIYNQRSTAEVKKLGARCIEQAGPDGFILGGTSSGTYGETAAENFIALVDVAREYAGQPAR